MPNIVDRFTAAIKVVESKTLVHEISIQISEIKKLKQLIILVVTAVNNTQSKIMSFFTYGLPF